MGYSLAEAFASPGLDESAAVIDRQPPGRERRRTRRPKAVRLQDVARAAGVSIATVSMVVNHNPRISDATVKRVRRYIDQMGYRTAGAAASAITPPCKPPSVTVLLPAQRHAFADGYFGELISGITDAAARLGHAVMFEQATPDFIRARQHINLLERREADGLLCLDFNDFHGFLDDFAAEPHRPVVLVDSHVSRASIDLVGCDYRSGAQQALNYLLQLGHRRIGLITSAAGGRCTRDVAEIYQAMMAEHGMRPGEGWIADGRFTEEGGDEAAERILRRQADVTALFAASDKMAIGALHAAQRRGMKVPGDLSIVGFDNLPHSAFMNPPLSTVHLPLLAVGAAACERLIERIAAGRTEVVNEKLATHLVVRESSAIARDLPAAGGSSAA